MQNPYADFDFSTTQRDLLLGIDLSNEFIYGILGSEHAAEIVPWAAWFFEHFQGRRVLTMDTHGPNYLDTQEGRLLPVLHGQKGTQGWELVEPIRKLVKTSDLVFEKDTFGSIEVYSQARHTIYDHIYLMGAKTGICVLANAVMAKTARPEAEIRILSKLCTCVTKDSHKTAIDAMRLLQMTIM